jgi:hypothetical protein
MAWRPAATAATPPTQAIMPRLQNRRSGCMMLSEDHRMVMTRTAEAAAPTTSTESSAHGTARYGPNTGGRRGSAASAISATRPSVRLYIYNRNPLCSLRYVACSRFSSRPHGPGRRRRRHPPTRRPPATAVPPAAAVPPPSPAAPARPWPPPLPQQRERRRIGGGAAVAKGAAFGVLCLPRGSRGGRCGGRLDFRRTGRLSQRPPLPVVGPGRADGRAGRKAGRAAGIPCRKAGRAGPGQAGPGRDGLGYRLDAWLRLPLALDVRREGVPRGPQGGRRGGRRGGRADTHPRIGALFGVVSGRAARGRVLALLPCEAPDKTRAPRPRAPLSVSAQARVLACRRGTGLCPGRRPLSHPVVAKLTAAGDDDKAY